MRAAANRLLSVRAGAATAVGLLEASLEADPHEAWRTRAILGVCK